MEFVKKELKHAYDCGISTLWLVNCSNIKPHVYPLDFAATLWNSLETEPEKHLEQYISRYYGDRSLKEMRECFMEYFEAALPYGEEEDEHAGEQFYNYVTRVLIHQWMKDGGNAACEELRWCGPAESFAAQLQWYVSKCKNACPRFQGLLDRCVSLADELPEDCRRLWKDSLLLQVKIHTFCLEGVIHFGKGYSAYESSDYLNAFYEIGQAADHFYLAEEAMKECGHDKWKAAGLSSRRS